MFKEFTFNLLFIFVLCSLVLVQTNGIELSYLKAKSNGEIYVSENSDRMQSDEFQWKWNRFIGCGTDIMAKTYVCYQVDNVFHLDGLQGHFSLDEVVLVEAAW